MPVEVAVVQGQLLRVRLEQAAEVEVGEDPVRLALARVKPTLVAVAVVEEPLRHLVGPAL
jgi:hypothetical protein